MFSDLERVIFHIKDLPPISSNPKQVKYLIAINRYSSNDYDRAYLLGLFFKHVITAEEIPIEAKKRIVRSIKNSNLENYFYLKVPPYNDGLYSFSLLSFFGGIAIIAIGFIQLISDSVHLGISIKYLAPIMHSGGYTILIGLVFFFGGYLRLRYEMKRKRLVRLLKQLAPA